MTAGMTIMDFEALMGQIELAARRADSKKSTPLSIVTFGDFADEIAKLTQEGLAKHIRRTRVK